jgi:uncharacterized protein with PIN domain
MNHTRFLCDVMLARFARYLRAAGHDTLLAGNTQPDSAIVAHAAREDRWLLTVDRGIMAHRLAAGRVLLLPHGSLDAQAAAVSTAFGLDWLARSFTRCLVDNAPLGAPGPDQLAAVPPAVRGSGTEVYACPHCGRLYWHGTHTRRMREQLTRWRDLPQASQERACR